MSARSTTSRCRVEPLPRTATLDEAPREVLEFAARVLQLNEREPRAIRRVLRSLHSDRDHVLGLLERLPPLCSLLLEVLVDAGGMLPLRTLNATARERIGGKLSELDPYLELLQAHLLVACLVSTTGFGEARERVALMDSAARTVAPLVGGLTLPVEPPAKTPAPALSSEERETLALATVTAHQLVRVNRDLTPNRSSIKKLAKSLGVEPDRVMGRLLEASMAATIAEHLEAFRPVVPALRKAAILGLGRSAVENDLESWLPASEWVPLERFARACWRIELDERFKLGGLSWASTPSRHRLRMHKLKSRRLEVAEHDGHTWVRRCARELRLTGDGHVTPNLEVYLGPSAHPSLIVTIGLGAELVQVDRVLTFRLSPQSVMAGLALGLTQQELTEALDRVGPHGAPDVVRQAVADFVRRARFARVEHAYAVHLPADSADAFCAKHSQHVLERATPQLVLVDPGWQNKDLHRSLRALGVHTVVSPRALSGPAERQAASELGRDAASTQTGLRPPTPSLPAPQLVHRLEEDRTGGFATSRDTAWTALEAIAGSGAEPEPPTAHIGAQLHGAPPAVQDLVRGSQKLVAQAKTQLEAWASHLLPARRAEVRAAQKLPLLLLPYLVLRPEWRARAIAGKTSLTDLIEAASRLCTPSRCSPEGQRLLKEAHVGGVAEAAMAALQSAVGPPPEIQLDSLLSRPAFDEEDFDKQDLDDEDFNEQDLDDEDFNEQDLDDEDLLYDDPERFAIKLPEPDAFPPLSSEQILRILEGATNERDPLFVKLRAPGGSEVRAVLPERFRVRGGRTMLLVLDLETSEGRVLELSRIESAVGADLSAPIPI